MPHFKAHIVTAVEAANSALRTTEFAVILEADTLAQLATGIGLSEADAQTIAHLYPEFQEVILEALKSAARHGRPAYLTWRHSAIQRLEITVPPPSLPDAPFDIGIQSRYIDDGINDALNDAPRP